MGQAYHKSKDVFNDVRNMNFSQAIKDQGEALRSEFCAFYKLISGHSGR